ncbi:MAG: hypothetical protein PHV34_17845 [Verrucomicrobiae bacterium]|nr:hypothetical protein [Verrucomicrobiae bacterium]
MPIIKLSGAHARVAANKYVMLKMDYGLIIDNGDKKYGADYYLFLRNERRIVKTRNVRVFLTEIVKLPDGSEIDVIGKCTVPFYNEYGVKIDNEYARVMDLLRRKNCRLIGSFEEDKRHASFCYCGTGFTILDKYGSGPASSTNAHPCR